MLIKATMKLLNNYNDNNEMFNNDNNNEDKDR